MENETLVNFGSEVKALGDGKISGLLVRFGSEDEPDISAKRDFFTAETDFDLDGGNGKSAVYYQHGQDKTLGKRKLTLNKGEMKATDEGIWFEAQLALRDSYEKMIYKMAEDGKLGFSSGVASHLVNRVKSSNGKAHHVKSWPLGSDASLTPIPAEPRGTDVIVDLKSLDIPTLEELSGEKKAVAPEVKAEEKPIATKSMKGIFETELAEQTPTFWDLNHILCDVAKDIAMAAGASDITGVTVDVGAKVAEAVTEFAARIIPIITAQINDFIEQDDERYFYLKSYPTGTIFNSLMDAEGNPRTGLRMQEHSETVLTAARELGANATATVKAAEALLQRFDGKQELDVKAGRVFSSQNRERIKKHHGEVMAAKDQLDAVATGLMDLYDKTDPMPKEEPKSIEPDAINQLVAEWSQHNILHLGTV